MSVKRCLLPLSNYKTDEEPMTTVATLEFIRGLSNKSTIVVMMLSSGRFAGCVFNK